MPVYELTLPDEVAAWILEEKKTQPQTYIENELMGALLKEYEKSVTKTKRKEADEEAKTQAAEMKKKAKLTEKKIK